LPPLSTPARRLSIALVIAVAVIGAILGDNVGVGIGREGGNHLLRRDGRYVHVDERRADDPYGLLARIGPDM